MENYRYLLQFFDELMDEIRQSSEGKRRGENLLVEKKPDPINALYLMGDFFDFWFAKGDRVYPGFSRAIAVLKEMQALGVQIHIFEGNHDFFLGDFFMARMGIPVYPNDASIEMDGRRFYIAHGDLVDRSNRRYLLLRRFLRSRFVYVLQKMLPARLLWWIALKCSDTSKAIWAQTGKQLTDKMCRFAIDASARGYDGVILGHSHQPLLWEFSAAGKKRVLVTLGDWLVHRSYLDYSGGRFSLKHFQNGVSGDRKEDRDFRFD